MTSRTLAMWWQLDPVFIVAGLAAAVLGLFIRKLRPYAVLLLVLVAVMLRPGGYLPVPYVIMLVPFAALLVAYIAERAVLAVAGITSVRDASVSHGWASSATSPAQFGCPSPRSSAIPAGYPSGPRLPPSTFCLLLPPCLPAHPLQLHHVARHLLR